MSEALVCKWVLGGGMQSCKMKKKKRHLTSYTLVLCGHLYFEHGWKPDLARCLGALCSTRFLDTKPRRGKKCGQEDDPTDGYIHTGAEKQV